MLQLFAFPQHDVERGSMNLNQRLDYNNNNSPVRAGGRQWPLVLCAPHSPFRRSAAAWLWPLLATLRRVQLTIYIMYPLCGSAGVFCFLFNCSGVAHSGRRNCIRHVNNPAQIFLTTDTRRTSRASPHIRCFQKPPAANEREALHRTAQMSAAEGTEQFATLLMGEFPETRVQKTVRRVKNPHMKTSKKKHLKHIVATFLCTQRKTQLLHSKLNYIE